MNNKLTKKDIENIEKESEEILDNFSLALEKVSSKIKFKDEDFSGFYLERDKFERTEENGCENDDNFKKEFLENAPIKNSDFILSEKGDWK